MATAAQRQGLDDYAKARREREAAEHAMLATLAASADTRRALGEAVGRGDEIAADGLKLQLGALEERAAKERWARDIQGAAMAEAGVAGFDLLSARHPLLLLPVRLEARFAWMDAGRVTFSANPALELVLLVRV